MNHSQLEEQLKRAAQLAPFFDQLRSSRDAKDLFQRIVDIGREETEGHNGIEKGAISSLGKNHEYERRKAALPVMSSTEYQKAVKRIADDLGI